MTQVPGGNYVPRCERGQAQTSATKTHEGLSKHSVLASGEEWDVLECLVPSFQCHNPHSHPPPTLRAQIALKASSVKTSKNPTTRAFPNCLPIRLSLFPMRLVFMKDVGKIAEDSAFRESARPRPVRVKSPSLLGAAFGASSPRL